MKKFLFLLVVVVMFNSCSQEEEVQTLIEEAESSLGRVGFDQLKDLEEGSCDSKIVAAFQADEEIAALLEGELIFFEVYKNDLAVSLEVYEDGSEVIYDRGRYWLDLENDLLIKSTLTEWENTESSFEIIGKEGIMECVK